MTLIRIVKIAFLWIAFFGFRQAVSLRADDASGGLIHINEEGRRGTVDSIDSDSGIVRLKDEVGVITSYRITQNTTITENGNPANIGKIDKGDSATVYLETITSKNELKKFEIND